MLPQGYHKCMKSLKREVVLKKKELGQSGLAVSAMGLGCMSISHGYGLRDDAESSRTLTRALELGINFLDTADMYGAGHNEEIVGRAIAGRRKEITVATKCGFVWDENGKAFGLDGRPQHIYEACENSLRRLKIETIDLYYLHRVDPRVPVEESVGAMSNLVKQGKARFLGLSETTADELRRAHKTHPITALQSEYSLWARDVETNILPVCRELGIGFVPYSPLGSGFLTGQLESADDFPENDLRRRIPRFQGENFVKNLKLVEIIRRIAAEKNCTPAQMALAWVLAQGKDVIPIPGTKRRKYLEENVGALDVTLDADELNEINKVFPPDAATGSLRSEKMTQIMGR